MSHESYTGTVSDFTTSYQRCDNRIAPCGVHFRHTLRAAIDFVVSPDRIGVASLICGYRRRDDRTTTEFAGGASR
jgi:hypothetical protein